jgi:hypothetical protein
MYLSIKDSEKANIPVPPADSASSLPQRAVEISHWRLTWVPAVPPLLSTSAQENH